MSFVIDRATLTMAGFVIVPEHDRSVLLLCKAFDLAHGRSPVRVIGHPILAPLPLIALLQVAGVGCEDQRAGIGGINHQTDCTLCMSGDANDPDTRRQLVVAVDGDELARWYVEIHPQVEPVIDRQRLGISIFALIGDDLRRSRVKYAKIT